MRIALERDSDRPLYSQIEEHLKKMILSGMLEPGTRLPAIRQLARDLGVNRVTVETAYEGLKAEGLADSKVGSGTYVLPPQPVPARPLQDTALPEAGIVQAPRPGRPPAPSLHETERIDLGVGTGDSALFPVEEFRKIYNRVLRRDGVSALDYGPPEGYPPLRDVIARILANQGLECQPEDILITTGSQQAITLAVLFLLKAGDTILVEAPTYSSGLDLFQSLGFNVIGIPVDTQGMQVEAVKHAIREHNPKLIYSVPTFQNPTGTCLSGARRRQLTWLAAQHGIHILEDDFVGDLRYEGRLLPPLKAFEGGHDWVIYISTFSKMLMPGLRVGFMVVNENLIEPLVNIKRVIDLATSNINQRGLAEFINIGRYRKFIRRSTSLYRHRRDVMLDAIAEVLPPEVRVFAKVEGGLFLWLELPAGQSAQRLRERAAEAGIEIAAGKDFFPQNVLGSTPEPDRCLRLNFAAHSEGEIVRGIKRLGQIFTQT